jgi:hypothetical protein
MVPEGTPDKWILWALHPLRPKPVAERYATFSGASEREAGLKAAGYYVEIELSESVKG